MVLDYEIQVKFHHVLVDANLPEVYLTEPYIHVQIAACMLVELAYLISLLLIMPLRNPYLQKETLMSMVC